MEKAFTFMMLKPLGLVEPVKTQILDMITRESTVVIRQRKVAEPRLIKEHYKNVKDTPHFHPITSYMSEKRVDLIIVEGEGPQDKFVERMRSLVGKSDPLECKPGQIRHLAIEYNLSYVVSVDPVEGSNNYCRDNLIHCSDSPEAAKREVGIWFDDVNILKRYAK
jgi:nucleoside-diphosphate kinase